MVTSMPREPPCSAQSIPYAKMGFKMAAMGFICASLPFDGSGCRELSKILLGFKKNESES